MAFAPAAGVRTKSSEKVWPGENEARRRCVGDGGGSFSLDMVSLISWYGERQRLVAAMAEVETALVAVTAAVAVAVAGVWMDWRSVER